MAVWPSGTKVHVCLRYEESKTVESGGRDWMIGHVLPGEAEFCAGSAFAFSFDIAGLGWGYGRVIEAFDAGDYTGPFMESGLYPTVDADNGRILGTGAGYRQWSRFGGYGAMTTKGVGLPGPYPDGLGIVPIVEGQIDTSQLAPGTYVLLLVAGAGHNVLRGDVELENDDALAYAVPANQVTGDAITFVLETGMAMDPDPRETTLATSVVTQGGKGGFGLEVWPSGDIDCVSIDGSELTVQVSSVGNSTELYMLIEGIADAVYNTCEDMHRGPRG